MSWIDWESETYPSNEDLLMVPVFGLFFPFVRFFLDRFIFERLARRFVPGSAKGASQDQQDEWRKRHIKFKESAWKCIYYLSAEIIALAVTYNEPWFTNTGNFWVGPGDQVWPDQKVKTKLKALYMYTAGFYTYGIFALIFWETRRSDFGVSMGHHVATVILIILSYLLRFARVGSIVLALHDASDVFLEVGKMFKYSGSNVVPSISFILFVISWIALRLIYYPFWILWSTRFQIDKEMAAKRSSNKNTDNTSRKEKKSHKMKKLNMVISYLGPEELKILMEKLQKDESGANIQRRTIRRID